MNKWEAVINYMNDNVGTIGSRQQLISYVQANTDTETWHNHNEYIQVIQARQDRRNRQTFTTIDCYKNYLIQAGIIHKIKVDGKYLQGKFYIPERIDPFITIKEVREKAYGPKLMMINTDHGTESMCATAGQYYVGPIYGSTDNDNPKEKSGYQKMLKRYIDAIKEPSPKNRMPEFLSKDDFKI